MEESNRHERYDRAREAGVRARRQAPLRRSRGGSMVAGPLRPLLPALAAFALFGVLTALLITVDVRPIGPGGSPVGLAWLNGAARDAVGVDWGLYSLTDWAGLVPVSSMLVFGMLGLSQAVRRRSLLAIDRDLWLLGGLYAAMLLCHLLFDLVPVNFRPVLIDGVLEPSYPSSHALLATGALGGAVAWARGNLGGMRWRAVSAACLLCTLFIVIGRFLSGVHWATDIAGGTLLGAALALGYAALSQKGER